MTNLEWALRYYDVGWQIMPCKDKVPIGDALGLWDGDWKPLQTERIGRNIIEWWWKKWPDAQIALICGKLSNVTVLDCDFLKDELTKAHLKAIGEKPGDLAEKFGLSITSHTGSGGRHVFFRYVDIPNSTKFVHNQLDIKSEGGYVILPPSPYYCSCSACGVVSSYAWDSTMPFSEENLSCGLPEFPQVLQDEAKASKKLSDKEWIKLFSGSRVGSRNMSAARITGKLLTVLPAEAAWEVVKALNLVNNKPPLEEKELWGTFKSITLKDYGQYPSRRFRGSK